jgi:hypothetical protein
MLPPPDLVGTRWSGAAELWLDPSGDEAQRSDCTITLTADGLQYTWAFEGTPHRGSVLRQDPGAIFTDSWHQPELMVCRDVPGGRGLFTLLGAYGPDDAWGWRIALSRRDPTGELVLQMTNIAPWGEEARAVRMVCTPDE